LNLAAGRNIDALRLLPTASPAAQQFWANEMGGLSTWLDVEDIPDEGRRAAETKTMLANALTRLSETAPLVIRNASFCTAIQSYGCVKRFEKNEFTANQDVLIYAEVENFITEPGLNGFRSSLKSSYRIFDAAGQCAAEQEFAPSEEYCQNARRDFFLGYRTRLSKDIKPGRYQLQLTIEDLIAHKIGQTSIEFAIKETGADSANSPAPGPGKP
jgi:hypothetical protein